MKIRSGFVSNSSSSSFVIKLRDITAWQLEQIRNHGERAGDDAWSIDVVEEEVTGHTYMDNFDMRQYLFEIGIADDKIEWEENS